MKEKRYQEKKLNLNSFSELFYSQQRMYDPYNRPCDATVRSSFFRDVAGWGLR